mmetsp:Transcript_14549/g.36961  ORF Transcript_14549/g.36961 Transcript_14549/m.36961 type:complete len:406 (-) Transcript_14549:220-1437(-)
MDSASADVAATSSSDARADAALESKARILGSGKLWRNVLDLPASACTDDVKRAFRQLALLHHPDKPGGDADTFKLVQEAYMLGLKKCKKGPPAAARKPEESTEVDGSEPGSVAKGKAKAKGKTTANGKAQAKGKAKAKAKSKSTAAGARPKEQEETKVGTSSPEEGGMAAQGDAQVDAGQTRAEEDETKPAGGSPKRPRPKSWALPAGASKAKICKVVQHWVSPASHGERTMPDEISEVDPDVLAEGLRASSCIAVDVREDAVVAAGAGVEVQGAARLSFFELFENPEACLAQISKLQSDGRPLILFSERGERMGACGIVGALLQDVFSFDRGLVSRLRGGCLAWSQWLDANPAAARAVEPLSARLKRRQRAAAASAAAASADSAGKGGEPVGPLRRVSAPAGGG